ncbi:CHAT domain-containing protein [Nemania abortiva]|nr:CHAT domain-containing protein [Nemania abortiva]
MASMENEVSCLTTTNYEARHLITQSYHLWRQVLDTKFWRPEGADIRAEDKESLEESIRLAWQALEIDPDSPDLAFYYMTLAQATRLMYFATGELDAGTLDEVVHFSTLALNATPEGKSKLRADLLYDLRRALYLRYKRHESVDDLEEAIQVNRQGIEVTEERYRFLVILTTLLGERYKNTRTSHDLEEVIRAIRQAIEATEVNWKRIRFLQQLLYPLLKRYTEVGDVHDLDEAILAGKQAVELRADLSDESQYQQLFPSEDNTERIALSQQLAELLIERFNKTRCSGDLEEAIFFGEQALILMPDTPDKARLLAALSLQSSISYSDPSAEIEGAIALLNRILNMRLDGMDRTDFALHVELRAREENPNYRTEHEKYILFLEREIEHIRDTGDPAKQSLLLMFLAERLIDKYMMTGRVVDLDRSIALFSEVLDKITGHEHEHKELYSSALAGLSHAFMLSFFTALGRGHDVADTKMTDERSSNMEKAIIYMRKYIDATPEISELEEAQLDRLVPRLKQFNTNVAMMDSVTKDIATLEEAINVAREQLLTAPDDYATPQSSPLLPLVFQSTWRVDAIIHASHLLQIKYSLTGEVAALDEAIQLLERAVDSDESGSALLGLSLHGLSSSLLMRYFHTSAKDDLERASTLARTLLHNTNLIPILRIRALSTLILARSSTDHEDMERLYQDAVLAASLIPRLVSPLSEHPDNNPFMLAGVASDAAALALEAGREPLVALQLLESGRGIVAASFEDLRADIPDLQARHPVLAARLTRLQKELSIPAPPKSPMFLLGIPLHDYEVSVDRRESAGREFDALANEIRQLPGFESALGSLSKADILEAARDGPIAVINVSSVRCDAILVERGRVLTAPLPRLFLEDIKRKAQSDDLGRNDILEWLWDAVTRPVLHALGLDQPLDDNHLRRIWWIPTGQLNGFPLHAAGYHSKQASETVIDRVMSSYSSSIKAIIHGRRRHMNTPLTPGQALLVAMPQTPGYSALRHSIEEISKVRDICNSMSLKSIDLQMPHKQDVLDNLPGCKVFHFAGHASASASNPFNGQLYLQDWKDNPLRVSDILGLNLRTHSPFLAYLSGCGTGRIKNENYLDESTHLISAFQLVGFRHVIGTLWDADDERSVDMARIVYESARDGGLTDESVCRGLHNASRALRDLWISELGLTGREDATGHTGDPIAHRKRPMETLGASPNFSDSEEDYGGDKYKNFTRQDWEAEWESLMKRRKEFLEDSLAYGMIQFSHPSRQAKTDSRGGLGLDSSLPSSSRPDVDAMEALTTGHELQSSLKASIDAMDALTLGHRANRCSRKIELDEMDDGEGGSSRKESPFWVPYVHFGV